MKFNNMYWIIISFILLYLVFKIIHYLSSEGYIIECLTNQESSNTSHTVDLPLTTTYSCQNFCSPTSRCAITGQQCFTDIDCPGCQPSTPFSRNTQDKAQQHIPGDNDAGKLTVGMTPQYSSLTSGYGTQKAIITDKMYGKPSHPNFGIDTWRSSFDSGQELFNKRYKPNQLPYMPNYPPIYSITGEFLGEGPLPSNY
jgi:hypothetical protein